MSESEPESSNPYQSPGSPDSATLSIPTLTDLVGAVIVAILVGGTVFLGTCFGSGFVVYNYTVGHPDYEWAYGFVWIGSGFVAIMTAIFVGRRIYNGAKNLSAPKPSGDSEEKIQ